MSDTADNDDYTPSQDIATVPIPHRPTRKAAVRAADVSHEEGYFVSGGALDSQTTDSQHIGKLVESDHEQSGHAPCTICVSLKVELRLAEKARTCATEELNVLRAQLVANMLNTTTLNALYRCRLEWKACYERMHILERALHENGVPIPPVPDEPEGGHSQDPGTFPDPPTQSLWAEETVLGKNARHDEDVKLVYSEPPSESGLDEQAGKRVCRDSHSLQCSQSVAGSEEETDDDLDLPFLTREEDIYRTIIAGYERSVV
ncbi:hypothetical protein OF83DRAFT_1150372 [Amylostereum chailletii]|nr:hypothetical protein OF83DRAFT_1150372 [Amylostereum chailletii]